MRMPLFVWLMSVVTFMILLALPPLSAAQIMLLIDRYLGAHFFDTQAGGSAVFWQHFFWIFGHPEVYILIIPAFACVSEIIPVFSRKPIFGYPVMVGATVMIGLISMSVWAHHMFSVGMTSVGNIFFAISTYSGGRADRDQDFQLARHDVRRQDSLRTADAFLHRVSLSVFDRGPDRHDAGRRAVQLAADATPTSSWRTFTTRSSADSSSAFSPASTTGTRKPWAECSTGGSASGISGCSSSAST